jgi:LPXTG-site transpeptidase (sortase) family protein
MSVFFERALLVLGLSCLGWYGLAAADAAYKEREARAAIEHVLTAANSDRVQAPTADATAKAPEPEPVEELRPDLAIEPTPKVTPKSDDTPSAASASESPVPVRRRELTFGSNVVGLLEIPRLRFSTPVLEGDDGATLRGAAGHLPDTPQPWEEGNSAIAAHRDGIFRPLRNIRIGDELRVQTPHGEIRYKVSDTHIVLPTDLSVLDSKTPHMLTLITCYPFNYIGAAPKRFIVHAERIVP